MPSACASLLAVLLGCTRTGACPDGTELRDDGACHQVGAGASGDGGAPGGDTGDGAGAQASGGASWSAADVAAALDAALSVGFVQALPLFSAYESYMEHREGTCPSMEDPNAEGVVGVWQTDHCQTTAGYIFEGFALYDKDCASPEVNDEDPGTGVDSRALVSQYSMEDADGRRMVGGGAAAHQCSWASDGGVRCFVSFGGSYLAEGREPWLDAGVEASLYLTHQADADGRLTVLQGGIGLPGVDISFDDLRLDWDACDGRPTGTIRVRDPSGWWFTLLLAHDCSGCGRLTLGDVDLGELCVDMADAARAAVEQWEEPCWE